ncbi:hypothetical protein BDZ91DRAFT_339952 [Kalaharituber pfeilii]|nr:hypothetical protein BDZ91DRAFT_339952 [Kalaharituber pfeilii]
MPILRTQRQQIRRQIRRQQSQILQQQIQQEHVQPRQQVRHLQQIRPQQAQPQQAQLQQVQPQQIQLQEALQQVQQQVWQQQAQQQIRQQHIQPQQVEQQQVQQQQQQVQSQQVPQLQPRQQQPRRQQPRQQQPRREQPRRQQPRRQQPPQQQLPWWDKLPLDIEYFTITSISWSHICTFCNTQLLNTEKNGWCCEKGKYNLPLLRPLPVTFQDLLHNNLINFSALSRVANNLFAFTAIGSTGEFIHYHGPANVAITGRVYHRLLDLETGNHSLRWFLYDSSSRASIGK